MFDHSDICHCLDYDPEKCPESCFRAKITKELREIGYQYPVSFAHLSEVTGICERAKENG